MLVVYIFWIVLLVLVLLGMFPTTEFGHPISARPHHWYFTYFAGILLGVFLLLAGCSDRRSSHDNYIVLPLGSLLVLAHSVATVVRARGRSTGTRRSVLICTLGQSLFLLLLFLWIRRDPVYKSVFHGLSVITLVGVICTRVWYMSSDDPLWTRYLGVYPQKKEATSGPTGFRWQLVA